jgi:ribulose-phosphate 3-epimerase
MLHIDVMDGHFVPNITLGPMIVEALRPHTHMVFDVHLMIENSDKFIPMFAKAGSDIITIHVEEGYHVHRNIQLIKSYGKKVGVSINPGTPISAIVPFIDEIDMLLIMSVNPGFGGQKYIKFSTDKIREAKNLINNKGLNIDIQG